MNTSLPPKNTGERRAWIKMMLEIKGTSFADIARELGVTRGAVRHIQDRPYPRMELAVANKIGYAPALIWPERYGKGA